MTERHCTVTLPDGTSAVAWFDYSPGRISWNRFVQEDPAELMLNRIVIAEVIVVQYDAMPQYLTEDLEAQCEASINVRQEQIDAEEADWIRRTEREH